MTPILEDMAELLLTSNKKKYKDDFNLAITGNIGVKNSEVALANVEVNESEVEVEAIGGGNIAR